MSKIFFISTIVILYFTSCIKNPNFEKLYNFKNEKWKINDTVKLEVEIPDSTQEYSIYISLRRNVFFKYSNIWLNIGTKAPDNSAFVYQNLEYKLENKNGQPTGNVLGNNIEHKLTIQKPIQMKKGKYEFRIIQMMRDTPLNNILTLGMGIQRKI